MAPTRPAAARHGAALHRHRAAHLSVARPLAPLVALWALTACGDQVEQKFTTIDPDIVAFTPTVDFGGVVVLYDGEATATVGNVSRAPLTITSIDFGDDADGVYTLAYDGTLPLELAEEETLDVDLRFVPATYIDYNRNLIIGSDDPDTQQLFIPISGSGVDGPIPDIALSPGSVDFGLITAGTSSQKFFTMTNEGEGPLTITGMSIEGASSFSFPSASAVPFDIGPGATTTVVVQYAPAGVSGDNARVVIESNDPDEERAEVVLLGNGGGDFQYPIAQIECPSGTVAPPITVPLDGRRSSDPLGGELTYAWQVVERPDGSRGDVLSPTDPYTEVFADIAGEWTVALQVTNEIGLASEPATCTFIAVPEDNVHVEMSWDSGSTDLDLHLIQAGFDPFDIRGDCHYCNPNPEWGESGGFDDPVLALDDTTGFGPENIQLDSPYPGDYEVFVHFWSDSRADRTIPVIATVKVWINGLLEHEESKAIARGEMWEVGFVRYTEAEQGFGPYGTDPARFTLPDDICGRD